MNRRIILWKLICNILNHSLVLVSFSDAHGSQCDGYLGKIEEFIKIRTGYNVLNRRNLFSHFTHLYLVLFNPLIFERFNFYETIIFNNYLKLSGAPRLSNFGTIRLIY